jgi:hypothetical protein
MWEFRYTKWNFFTGFSLGGREGVKQVMMKDKEGFRFKKKTKGGSSAIVFFWGGHFCDLAKLAIIHKKI